MTAKHLLSEIVAGLDGDSNLIERLRSNGALPICPFEKRSPEYWTTPNDKPCKFCGGLPEGPDKCTGADMRIMGEAADRIEKLEKALKQITSVKPEVSNERFRFFALATADAALGGSNE